MKITPVRKAVFPAAGLGTRFLPATKAQPKEMLTLVDKPQIQYGVEEVEASGIDLIVLVTGRGKQAIENHFDRAVELEELVEKPAPGTAPSNLAIIGRYLLTPDIFPAIRATPADANGEIQLTHALAKLREKRKVYGCAFQGRRYDGGYKLGFLQATVEFALKRPDLGPEFLEYLKTLRL